MALLAASHLRSAMRRDVNQCGTTLHVTHGETGRQETRQPRHFEMFYLHLCRLRLRSYYATTRQDMGWLCGVYGCLVTEINDISHAGSSSSRCLSSPFPELSIITVGVYFTFLQSRLLPILSSGDERELRDQTIWQYLLNAGWVLKNPLRSRTGSVMLQVKIMLFKSVKNQDLKFV